MADVLFGDISPSGHLPLTFPKNIEQVPAYENYSMKGRTYKYMTEEPMYPFGFGLTYSKTAISNLKLNASKIKKDMNLEAQVDVSNTGNYDIDEVVQLYICPKDTTGGLPIKSLKAFQRISLKKGETKPISFNVTAEMLKVVNTEGAKVWRKGEYQVVVGNCSPSTIAEKLGAATPQTASFYCK